MPECRSRFAPVRITSSPTRPRSAVVIAGVPGPHMPVSQTRAISALSSLAFLARKAGSEGDPVSSSPSNSTVIRAGRTAERLERPAGLEKGHQLAFVVGGAASHDLLAVGPGFELRFERRTAPKVQRVDRLHVIVAIKQNVGGVPAVRVHMADDHRPPLRRMLGGLESEAAKFTDKPVRRPLAIRKMGGHGRDGGDRQQREQPLERRPLLGVDRGENSVCRGHVLRLPVALLWRSCSRPTGVASNRLQARPFVLPTMRRPENNS